MRRGRRLGVLVAAVGLAATLATGGTAASAADQVFPSSFALPDGFRPEGIAIGPGPVAYVGSLADGSIYRADLVTGAGEVIGEAPGTPSVGLALDGRGRLFVSGGGNGDARVVDTRTGEVVASYQLTTEASFVNDVVVTNEAAWFTDSVNPVLYRLPLGPAGQLPDASGVESLPLSGDIVWDPEDFNANGIVTTPDRRALLIIQSGTGLLFRVEPGTGVTSEVDLGDEALPMGDGLLRHGRTLYAVQNRANQVAVVRLNQAGTAGTVERRVTDPRFDVPTTVAMFRDRLYLPNARFGTPPEPTTSYSVVAIPRP